MNILGVIILVALFLLAVFTLTNWSVLTATTTFHSSCSMSRGRSV